MAKPVMGTRVPAPACFAILSKIPMPDNKQVINISSKVQISAEQIKEINNISYDYDIIIEKIYTQNNSDNKSMLIKVIDEELLEETGGIIRGLSGAPIVQKGKFIGAITNVLVSNPKIGYAIFGDLMIKQIVD